MATEIEIQKTSLNSLQNGKTLRSPLRVDVTTFNDVLKNDNVEERGDILKIAGDKVAPAKNQAEYVKKLGSTPSYSGEFPSPLPLMWYAPTEKELTNAIKNRNFEIPANTIRGWVKDASTYHTVPHELLAALLQNENPIREKGVKGFLHNVAQYVERSGTTLLQIIDDKAWDIIPDKIGNTRIASGSSGIGNLTRDNLRVAVKYTKDTYNKDIIPSNVRFRDSGFDSDTQISGNDLKSDLYYTAAYMRRLIDIITEGKQPDEGITIDQAEKVLTIYNGPLERDEAKAYGKRAMNHIFNAQKGVSNLYFYEK